MRSWGTTTRTTICCRRSWIAGGLAAEGAEGLVAATAPASPAAARGRPAEKPRRGVTGRARGTLDLTLLDARAHHGATTSGGGGVEPTPRAQFTSRTFSRGGGEDLVEAFSKARHGRVKDLAELFKSGVDPAARDINGLTLLHMAAQNNQRKATKLVLKHTDFATNPPRLDLIDAQTKQGHTALHYCFAYGYQDLGNYLLSLGADDTITNVHGMTCYEGLDPDEETRETLNNPEMRALARRKHMQRRVEAARPGATTPRIGPDRGDDFHRDGHDGRSRRSRAHEDAYGGWDGQGGRGGHPPHPGRVQASLSRSLSRQQRTHPRPHSRQERRAGAPRRPGPQARTASVRFETRPSRAQKSVCLTLIKSSFEACQEV